MTTLFLTSTENWGFFSCMASPSSLNILSRWSAPPLSPTTHAFSQHRRHMRSHRTDDSTNHRRSSYKFKFNTLSLTNFRSEKQCISREKKKKVRSVKDFVILEATPICCRRYQQAMCRSRSRKHSRSSW